MPFRFTKHYTVAEAPALLPAVESWLSELIDLREAIQKMAQGLESRLRLGADLGGNTVNDHTRTVARFQGILSEFQSREIQLKDLDRGLVDFPHLRAGMETFSRDLPDRVKGISNVDKSFDIESSAIF